MTPSGHQNDNSFLLRANSSKWSVEIDFGKCDWWMRIFNLSVKVEIDWKLNGISLIALHLIIAVMIIDERKQTTM